jgi:peptide chain release factor 1
MHDKLVDVEMRYEEVNRMLVDPNVISNRSLYQQVTREHKELGPVVEAWRELCAVRQQIEDNELLSEDADPEMRALAREELEGLRGLETRLAEKLKLLLLPKDPLDDRNVFLELRAGAGGDEAALFAADLFRMYSRFAEAKRWKVELVDASENQLGGFKEVIASITGEQVYSQLKYESGVHRVQRVPETESQGRIHTSTVTVAVLPEAEDVDVHIEDKDLRIDVYRSSGPGGQSVNTTDSAVRITHLPTGLVVICQDEKSQHKNKAKALKVLRARLLEAEIGKQEAEIAANRRAQVGTGDRSERIRTYNYAENRVSDHRIGLTLHRLDTILGGDLDMLIDPVREHYQAEALRGGAGSR